MKWNKKYSKWVMMGLLGLATLVFFIATYEGLSLLKTKSQKMVDLKLQNKVADEQLTNLLNAKRQVQQYSYFNDVAKTVIPSDKNQTQAVLDIVNTANDSGIALQSIAFPNSTLGAAALSSGSSDTGQSIISQAKPVTGIAGLYSLQITITPQTGNNVPADKIVTYSKFNDFLKRIEKDRRTAQVTQVSVQPQKDGSLNFTLVINIFIKPGSQ